jgi:hypothetical protein
MDILNTKKLTSRFLVLSSECVATAFAGFPSSGVWGYLICRIGAAPNLGKPNVITWSPMTGLDD